MGPFSALVFVLLLSTRGRGLRCVYDGYGWLRGMTEGGAQGEWKGEEDAYFIHGSAFEKKKKKSKGGERSCLHFLAN